MPQTVQVKVNTVNHTTQTSNAGNELNYVEITGFDATNSKGFKKRFFATKKDGTATMNAEKADSLNQDDWIEITLDDTSYHNVQTLKKIQEPAGMTSPSQSSAAAGNPKTTKRTYKPDPEKAKSIARSVALKAAVDFACNSSDTTTVDDVIVVADRFELYLAGQTVDGEIREPLKGGGSMTNATTTAENNQPQDDDIPF